MHRSESVFSALNVESSLRTRLLKNSCQVLPLLAVLILHIHAGVCKPHRIAIGNDRRCGGIQGAALLGHLRIGMSRPRALRGGHGGRSGTGSVRKGSGGAASERVS